MIRHWLNEHTIKYMFVGGTFLPVNEVGDRNRWMGGAVRPTRGRGIHPLRPPAAQEAGGGQHRILET